MVSAPIINFGHAFVQNLPNLFTLLVLGGIVCFVLRSLKHIFEQIGAGKVRIKGFYRDWADPTYRIDELHNQLHLDGGLGLRVMTHKAVCRVDLSVGEEGFRVVAMYGHPF